MRFSALGRAAGNYADFSLWKISFHKVDCRKDGALDLRTYASKFILPADLLECRNAGSSCCSLSITTPDILRRRDTDTHSVDSDSRDGDLNFVIKDNCLSYSSAEYKHD